MSAGALIAVVLLSSKTLQPVLQVGGLLNRFALAKESIKKLSAVFNLQSAEEQRRQTFQLKDIKSTIYVEDIGFEPDGLNRSLFSTKRLRIKFEKNWCNWLGGFGKINFFEINRRCFNPNKWANQLR